MNSSLLGMNSDSHSHVAGCSMEFVRMGSHSSILSILIDLQRFWRNARLLYCEVDRVRSGCRRSLCIKIIGDTIPNVIAAIFPSLPHKPFLWLLTNRRAIIILCVLSFSYPLSLYRDIAKVFFSIPFPKL